MQKSLFIFLTCAVKICPDTEPYPGIEGVSMVHLCRFVGFAYLYSLSVVLNVFHKAWVHSAALLHHQPLALEIEYPYLALGKIRVRFSEHSRFIKAAEFFPPLRSIQKISRTFIKQFVLGSVPFKLFPVLVINFHYVIWLYHFLLRSACKGMLCKLYFACKIFIFYD